VAGILEDGIVRTIKCYFAAERLLKRRRIFNSELIRDLIRRHSGEAFRDFSVRCCTAETLFIGEIRGFHHQRVAFPAANRVAHPFTDVLGQMLGIHPDDAGIVDHFNDNHHHVLTLHDLIVIVVKHRQHRRAGTRAKG